MARADRRSAKRAKPHAAVAAPRRGGGDSWEDQLFFARLRRHAKWMFVFLALIFGFGFVLFGIGAGGTGLGDILRGSGGGGDSPSVSEARKATEKNPKDAAAWRELSTALQTQGDTDEAIQALTRYVDLRRKDAEALRELGGLYLAQGRSKTEEVQLAQYRASFATGGADAILGPTAADGNPLFTNPITSAIQTRASESLQAAVSEAQTAYSEAVNVYKRLVTVIPKDPNVQLELAQAAQQAGDQTTAIAAYTAFLRLAPDDPNAAIVRQQLKQLTGSAGGASG
jgi:regulator of sirC expression with transglutaminase-like and TPR domain